MKFVVKYLCGPIAGCERIIDASDAKEAEKIFLESEPGAKIESVAPAE